MPRLAERTSRIASSPTMKVTATVDRLRREGVEVVDLGAGEPDFPTPAAINAAAHAAIDQNFTKYTPVGRHAGSAPGDLRSLPARLRRGIPGVRGHHLRRREAGALQHVARLVQPGRRSDHARAVLADVGRTGQAGRRDTGDRPHLARGRLRDHRRPDSGRHRSADARHSDQLAVQSDRRADLRSGADGDRQGSGETRDLGDRRFLLREVDLRRGPAQSARRAGPVLPRLLGHLRLGVEGLCHDGMALWLVDRAGGRDRGGAARCRAMRPRTSPRSPRRRWWRR